MNSFPIIVADDDACIVRLLQKQLGDAGYTVFLCGDGNEALGLVQRNEPVLLLADWSMPGMTGLELCRKIRASRSDLLVYSVLLTGNDAPNQIAAGLDAGADDYLIKPVCVSVLLARVRLGQRVLGLRIRQDEHARELEYEIAERRRVERELRSAKETAESTMDALQDSIQELKEFNKLAVGRELRMINLKQEINDLCAAQGKAPKYTIIDEEVPV